MISSFINRQYKRLKVNKALIVKISSEAISVTYGLKTVVTNNDQELYAFLSNNNL